MTIENPHMLLGILLLVPVIALQLRAYLKGRTEIAVLAAQWSEDEVQRLYTVKAFFSALAFDLFLVLAILAVADIAWGEQPVEEDRSGLDVAVVVDVSRSMLVGDVAPSRLDRSIAVIRAVSRQLPLARMGLIAFKGDATTLLPLTEDANALEIVLDGVGPALISAPGTNVEAGLAEALRAFPEATFAHRAVMLVSDGESLEGDPDGPLSELRDRGIPVISVVAGTPEGAPVPAGDGTTVLDPEGRPVISRANATLLARIATASDGALIRLDAPDVVEEVTSRLARFAEIREREGFRLVPRRRYRLFLGGALLALALGTAVRVIRWRGMF